MLVKYLSIFYPFFTLFFVLGQEDWTYQNQTAWPKLCLNGKEQSPIGINTKGVTVKKCTMKLKFKGYYDEHKWTFKFEHENVIASIADPANEKEMTISCGDLKDNVYKLEQFHFHWLSEHKIDNNAYDYEVHLVHYNKKYGSFSKALGKEDGVAVVGRFFKIVDSNTMKPISILKRITQVLSSKGKEPASLTTGIGDAFVAKFDEYYTYMGSLTTPPCTEKVKWIIDTVPREVGPKNLILEKYVNGRNKTAWPWNFRNLQKIGNRDIYKVDPE